AISLSTVGPGCSEAPPSVAPRRGSTQERFCMKRASRAGSQPLEVPDGRDLFLLLWPRRPKKTVAACLITSTQGPEPVRGTRGVRRVPAYLWGLADWLQEARCTHVAMESTGVYWRPVYNLLEGQFELLVVNAQHIKAVPGRKTDVKDAAWIAHLLRHGLSRGSFIASKPQRQLRKLTRYRSTLVQEHARTLNRLQAVLEDANLKLASVVTDISGVSPRAMLAAILAGQRDVEALADGARGGRE